MSWWNPSCLSLQSLKPCIFPDIIPHLSNSCPHSFPTLQVTWPSLLISIYCIPAWLLQSLARLFHTLFLSAWNFTGYCLCFLIPLRVYYITLLTPALWKRFVFGTQCSLSLLPFPISDKYQTDLLLFTVNLWNCCTTWHLLPFRYRELKISESMHTGANTGCNITPPGQKKKSLPVF